MPKKIKDKRYVLDRIEVVAGCWLWKNHKTKAGYGTLKVHIGEARLNKPAHRLSYELFKGEVPAGLVLDHLCRVRHCVNPSHLEAVTIGENTRRGEAGKFKKPWFNKTICKNGHAFDEKNTYIKKNGAKSCRACMKSADQRYKLRLQEAARG